MDEPGVERSPRRPSDAVLGHDEDRLAQFGYKQELRRDWGLAHNFGVSFSIISVITGITTLFSYGLNTGGPAVMSVGWILVSALTLLVAVSMAEIVSAIPTSGGPYFWAALLAPPRWSPFAAWLTGWFNLLGQVAVTTGISFGLAGLVATAAKVRNPAFEGSAPQTIGIYAAVLVSHALVNSFGVRTLRHLNNVSIFLHSAGVTAIAVAVLARAPTHQPASFVFGTFYDGTGLGGAGWSIRASPAYVAMCGSLMSQYTLTGFDASAHLSEETRRADWSAPIGVVSSVGFSAVFGFFVLMAFLFSIQDFEATLDNEYDQPVLKILVDVFGPNGALAVFSIIMICVWHCGLFSMTSNSRMMFAFSRDGGIPNFFHKVDDRFRSPIRAVWLAASLSFALALPSLGSSVAFTAATSVATIGLYLSYGLPILIGLAWPRNLAAIRGPFDLGRGPSRAVAAAACAWIACITVVFCLPEADPVTSQTLNYTAVAVGIIAVGAVGSWVLWARRWFVGPAEEAAEAMRLGVDPAEPGALERKEAEAEAVGAEKGAEKGAGANVSGESAQ